MTLSTLARTLRKIALHPLFKLLLLGFVLRATMLFLDFSFDVNNFIAWAAEAHEFGLRGFYDRPSVERYSTEFPNYPPIPIFLFYIFSDLYQLINKTAWQINLAIPLFPSDLIFILKERGVLAGVLKLPAVFADVGIAVLMYLFAKRLVDTRKSKLPLIVASLILFNPAFFYNSAYWGQIEAIPLVFVLASFYFLLYTKNSTAPSVFFALALLSKQTALVFLPVFLLVHFGKYRLQDSLRSLLMGVFVFWIGFLTFYQSGSLILHPFETYFERVISVSGIPFVSNHAFNFWALITQWHDIPDTNIFLFGLSYRLWGYLVTGAFLLVVLYTLTKSKIEVSSVLSSALLTAFGEFLFLTKIHERHMAQVLPFLLLIALKDRKMLYIFVLLSLIHFANLYHNWPVPYNDLFASMVRSPVVRNTLIGIVLFTFFFLLRRYLEVSSQSNLHRVQKGFG